MGDSAIMSRASRFIEEFNEEYIKAWGMESAAVVRQSLGQDDCYLFMALYATITTDKGEVEVMIEGTQFDLDEGTDEELVDRVHDVVGGDRQAVVDRLLKTELIHNPEEDEGADGVHE